MEKYFKSLSFRITFYIVFLILIIGLSLSTYMIYNFSKTLNNQLSETIKYPAKLMSDGLLDFQTASDKNNMEIITGLKINECLIIGVNGKIYYSIDPNHIGKKYSKFKKLRAYKNKIIQASKNNTDILTIKKNNLIVISPIYEENTRFLGYLCIKADISTYFNQKLKGVIILSILSFIGLMTYVIIFVLIFKNNVIKRIHNLLGITSKIKNGDLKINPIEIDCFDEIGILEENINSLIENLKLKVSFADQIEQGDFGSEYKLPSSNDLLGKILIKMRDSLKKATNDEKKRRLGDNERNWTTQGLTKFADILRKDASNLEELTYSIISNLVSYTRSNQASLFLLNNEDENADSYLELNSCYAYDRKKYVTKRIEIGEGMIGAVAHEKATMHISEIPESYIEITSGLGKGAPKALLIVPLVREDELLGVLEIASFNSFRQYQIEFIEKLGESIASTIYNTRINATTSELLKVSQTQSEQMRYQEDQMKQNMEELNATQEELTRKHNELNKKIIELEKKIKSKDKQIERYKLREKNSN